jgi:hypothetical protein
MPLFGRIELAATNARNIAAGVRRQLGSSPVAPDENKRQIMELAEAVERLSDAVVDIVRSIQPQ